MPIAVLALAALVASARGAERIEDDKEAVSNMVSDGKPGLMAENIVISATEAVTSVARKLQLGKKESLVDDFGAWKKVYKIYPQEFPSPLAADAYTGWNDDQPDLTDNLYPWDVDVVQVLTSSDYIVPTRILPDGNDFIHPSNILDNNLYTIWLSETNPPPGVWIEIDLGVPLQRLNPEEEAAIELWQEEAHERFPGPDGEEEGFTGFNVLYMEIFWAGWTAPEEYKVWAWREMDADARSVRIHKQNMRTMFQRLDTLPGPSLSRTTCIGTTLHVLIAVPARFVLCVVVYRLGRGPRARAVAGRRERRVPERAQGADAVPQDRDDEDRAVPRGGRVQDAARAARVRGAVPVRRARDQDLRAHAERGAARGARGRGGGGRGDGGGAAAARLRAGRLRRRATCKKL